MPGGVASLAVVQQQLAQRKARLTAGMSNEVGLVLVARSETVGIGRIYECNRANDRFEKAIPHYLWGVYIPIVRCVSPSERL